MQPWMWRFKSVRLKGCCHTAGQGPNGGAKITEKGDSTPAGRRKRPIGYIRREMLERFRKYLQQEGLHRGGRVVLAVSGGLDSVVMAHLFRQAELPFLIGHCNFQLRGAESDEDERFVENLAEELGVPFFCGRFDTEGFARARGLSIQAAARELRYTYLEELRQMQGCESIATAHHLTDAIETLLLNLVRGTGLRGLRSIRPRRDHIIRPLLFATREELEAHAQARGLRWREDASNRSEKYRRNYIRLEVLPRLRHLNPALERSCEHTLQILRETERLTDWAVQRWLAEHLSRREGEHRLPLKALQHSPAPRMLLFEWLRPFGFNRSQVGQILQSLEERTGRLFLAPRGRLLFDRQELILSPHPPEAAGTLTIEEGTREVALPEGRLLIQPLGMGGRHQKLQDFFSNRKLSRLDKEKVWILESNGEICWVVGLRIDERFKITPQTTRCLRIEWQPFSESDPTKNWP
ncbi:MAG: tRNA lysidine(34) synthetase TilS [Bacteroidetes bacterium]|nr:MAG: tRNA lysidine(34) synthetase TilS [Bacteroidota bacterium]